MLELAKQHYAHNIIMHTSHLWCDSCSDYNCCFGECICYLFNLNLNFVFWFSILNKNDKSLYPCNTIPLSTDSVIFTSYSLPTSTGFGAGEWRYYPQDRHVLVQRQGGWLRNCIIIAAIKLLKKMIGYFYWYLSILIGSLWQ